MKRCPWWVLLLACVSGVEAATFSPAITTNDLNNPHKGFMLWGTDYADGAPNNFYGATIYHVYAPWREIETADQVFDWGRFETNHLLPILADHPDATFVLRPVADYPDGQNSGIALFYTGGELTRDFPAFLTNAPLSIPAYPYTSCDGDGPGITPDWNRPAMLNQLVQFVQAFGARYDGDPRITAIQVGLLGLWGEWHQSGCDARAPSNAVKVAVRDAYAAAFTNTPLQTRYARDPDSLGVSFGFHEDYFPSFTAPCIYGFPSCDASGDWNLSYGFQHVNPAAATNWRVNPISGESPLNSQKRAWTNDADDVMTVLRDYHFSFLGPAGGHETNGRQAKLNPMKRLLGYNYHLLRVDWPETAALGVPFPVTLALTNSGAAPCYHPFRVEIALCAADGLPAWRTALTNNLRALVPGWHAEWLVNLVPTGLTAGTYSLRVGILDPRTGQPGVRMQSAGEDMHGRIAVGEVTLQDPWTMDSDGDGLPDGWELAHFGHPTHAEAQVDEDGDGQSNLDHYISGTDPTNRFSFFAITDAYPGGVSGVRVQSVTNRRYRLWRSTELVAGAWSELPVDLLGNGLPLDLMDTNPPAGAFYRAAVELVP